MGLGFTPLGVLSVVPEEAQQSTQRKNLYGTLQPLKSKN
jgi:hypothetical protein